MAKSSNSIVKDVNFNGDLILRLLVGILFLCIGIQGILGESRNDLFRALNNEVLEIILGIIIILCGVLLIVPSFLKQIGKVYVKISMILVLAIWIITIILSDFYYGFNGIHGSEWFEWIENFIYHLLILFSVYKVSSAAFK